MTVRVGAFLIICGALAIAGSGSALTRHVDRFAGRSGDFWHGVPIGIALGLLVGAVAVLIHDRRRRSA